MAFLGDWGRRNSPYFSAFAVGFLLVGVFFHLIPEALAASFDAWRWIVIGLGLVTGLWVLLRITARRQADSGDLAFGYASIVAIGSHSLLDGVIYVTTYHDACPFDGGLATFGLLLHEYPEGVIAFFLLREAGMGRMMAGLWAFMTASVTTIVGALAGAALIDRIDQIPIGSLMGLTAGGLIYIIFLHLAPHAGLTPHRRGYLTAGIGVIIALAAVIFRDVLGHH